MNSIKNLFSILSLLSICLISCRNDGEFAGSTEKISPRTGIWLYHSIELSTDSYGNYSFVDDIDSVRVQVEYLFTVRNTMFTSVDEFGIDSTEADQYFYVVQYGSEGSVTYYGILNTESGQLTIGSAGTGSAVGFRCANEKCCAKCVKQNDNCVCNQTEWSCIQSSQTDIKCKKINAQVI